ncbi:Holliday junction recognition protein isoform X2 [Hemicordylus capensis]|uniref:Holliday junction recognition protein isoform X2 n=1 Tax=Hemicordylus capensis TaxID=884348 RepID=UPI0023044BCB|nr:Holliday junction recognition protein isoform X2 [Hemicordylus capensis]
MDPREAGGGRESSSSMDRHLRSSRRRFTSVMSSIIEKYNFPFDGDTIVSIKSLTYDTPDGPKSWGEESITEITKNSDQDTVQCQKNADIKGEQISDAEDEDYEDYQSSEEEQFTNSHGENLLDFGHKNKTDLASIKRRLENTHIKENIPLVHYSGTPDKNKFNVEMDVLLEDCTSSLPKLLTVTRTEANNVHQRSPSQELVGDSISDHHAVVLRKQAHSTHGATSSIFTQLCNSASPVLSASTTVEGNQSLWNNNETGYSSFLEMYESANEHCSWNNVTIADLYPGMVKELSRLMCEVSYKASSSLLKRYRYGYWHPKKTKLNGATERVRKFRALKVKPSLTITKDVWKRNKLPMANNGSNSTFDYGKPQRQCSLNNVTRVMSSTYNTNRMETNCSAIAEYHSYTQRPRQHAVGATIFPCNISTEETFLVEGPPCIPSFSDCIKKGQSSKDYSSANYKVDSGQTLCLAEEDSTERMSTMTFKPTSCLSLSLNSSTSISLQNIKFSPVKTLNKLPDNHEIKKFSTAVSLQRSHSFPSLPINRSPIKAQKKHEDAFEKMYKELCSPKLQKPAKFASICTSPRKSPESHLSVFNRLPSKTYKNPNTFDSIYQKLCSEGFPKIPTFLRAANLKRYEGIQMSETVNALVNSPIRTLPAVTRIKRAANFYNEDLQFSPMKRLKNISENSSYRICQKPPYWKNINFQKSDITFTLHTPNTNNWASKNLDTGFFVPSNHSFLARSSTCMQGCPENSAIMMGESEVQVLMQTNLYAEITKDHFRRDAVMKYHDFTRTKYCDYALPFAKCICFKGS